MVTVDGVRAIALQLLEAVESPHHGTPSFRVRGRVFATLPDATHLNVMIGEGGIRALAASRRMDCTERWWGERLAALTIDLDLTDEQFVREMLEEAWLHKKGGAGGSHRPEG